MNYNTVVIGSGVAGMTAALYLKRAGISVCVLEKDTPGGQITRTSMIENYPGIKNTSGPDLALSMYNQLTSLDVSYQFTSCVNIKIEGDKKIIETKNGNIICQNVIIATGRSPRRLNLPGEEKFIGNGISFCAICDGGLYKNKNVAVIGGGTSALEEALYLSKICSSVTLIHRREDFRADNSLVDSVNMQENISVLTNKNVLEFIEDDNHILIKLSSPVGNEEIKVDACFEYIGQVPNTCEFIDLGITLENGYIEVNKNYETKVDGIYAIGDCIQKELYQIITACYDGAMVANTIIKE